MPQLRKHPLIRIVSNGPRDLQVFDNNTGEEILKGMVRSAHWEIGPNQYPIVRLELVSAAIEAVGELPEVTAAVYPEPSGNGLAEHTAAVGEMSDKLRAALSAPPHPSAVP